MSQQYPLDDPSRIGSWSPPTPIRYREGDVPEEYGDVRRWAGPAIPVTIANPVPGRIVLMGWSVRETTTTATGLLVVRNGADATGLESAAIALNPAGTSRDWLGEDGVLLDNGYFPVITGTLAGAIWVRYDRGARR